MGKIKFATMRDDAPRFVHNGINVSKSWTEIETDELSDESRTALAEYTGRFIQVHPDDASAFASYIGQHGYEYKDGQVTDTRSAEERERERAAQAGQGTGAGATAKPIPPRDDAQPGNFQVPPGAESDLARDARDTSPDKPSNKPRGR